MKRNNSEIENQFFNKALQNDNVFVEASVKSLAELTGMKVDPKVKNVIVSEGKIVSAVSGAYGFLDNRKYYYAVEEKLIDADIKYVTRSINKGDKHFAVDYILSDESYSVDVKNGMDKIKPMLRFTNSYAGGPVGGRFGFFREVCANTLNIATSQVGFGIRHKANVEEVVIPEIGALLAKFMDNEYYALRKKFEVLAEKPITDLSEFVKFTLGATGLFKYEASEKNLNTPSKNAQLVMDIITKEATGLGVEPNLWLGYNAFNEFIHSTGKKFNEQRGQDIEVFSTILEMAN